MANIIETGGGWLTTLKTCAILSFGIMLAWVIFLEYDCWRKDKLTRWTFFKLTLHMWLAIGFLWTSMVAENYRDPWLVWCAFLMVFRHYKTVINIIFWFRYKPAIKPSEMTDEELKDQHSVTVVVPTVGPAFHPRWHYIYEEMICGLLYNRPEKIIFSVMNESGQKKLETMLCGHTAEDMHKPIEHAENQATPAVDKFAKVITTRKTAEGTENIEMRIDPNSQSLLEKFVSSKTPYQVDRGLLHFDGSQRGVQIQILNANQDNGVTNKRTQMISAMEHVSTKITSFVDDTAIWRPKYLLAILPAFIETAVSLVGSRKWVKRLPRPKDDPALPWYMNTWNSYVFGFWNTVGALYLIRHNFEACATNAADGGIFTVSGRTNFVRSGIVKDPAFQDAFLNEYLFDTRWGKFFGPIAADDDNFLTLHVMKKGLLIKFQSSEEATVDTVLGHLGFKGKLWGQFLRWSRTTIRQYIRALFNVFSDLSIWWEWPITVWTTYLPWMYNAALIWDSLMVRAITWTEYYKASAHHVGLMLCLLGFIYGTKLIKTSPWFWKYPRDFFLYFFPIPAYPLFVYGHSLLKAWTWVTFWNTEWSGRPELTEKPKNN